MSIYDLDCSDEESIEEIYYNYDFKIYPRNNIKHILEEWGYMPTPEHARGPYTHETSNEWELIDGDKYEFYFYAYDDKNNVLYLMDGFGSNPKPSFKKRKIFQYMSDTFNCSIAYERIHSNDRTTYVIQK
jgi:hypothetical protein